MNKLDYLEKISPNPLLKEACKVVVSREQNESLRAILRLSNERRELQEENEKLFREIDDLKAQVLKLEQENENLLSNLNVFGPSDI